MLSDTSLQNLINHRNSTSAIAAAEFVQKAQNVHGNRYDYSKAIYINARTPVTITCSDHGDFTQKPKYHVGLKQGCPRCAIETRSKAHLKSSGEFIDKATKVHGNCYDYSKVKYEHNRKPVTIVCKEHGEFNQKPRHHLDGNSCPRCSESKGEAKIAEWLTSNGIKYEVEKSIPEFSNIKKFDFYLPDQDLYLEYDGVQHFKPVEQFGGSAQLEVQKQNDLRTNLWCKNNNIKLVRISCFENVEEKLRSIV